MRLRNARGIYPSKEGVKSSVEIGLLSASAITAPTATASHTLSHVRPEAVHSPAVSAKQRTGQSSERPRQMMAVTRDMLVSYPPWAFVSGAKSQDYLGMSASKRSSRLQITDAQMRQRFKRLAARPYAFAILITMVFPLLKANAGDTAGKVRTLPVPALGHPIVAKTDAKGTIHLLCDSLGGQKYAKSTDGDMTFSSPVPAVARGSQATGLEYSAWDMAVGKGGRVHVAMSTNAWKLKLPHTKSASDHFTHNMWADTKFFPAHVG